MGCIPFQDPVEEAFFNEIIGKKKGCQPILGNIHMIGMDSDIGVTV